jgi:tetratricopeptide (TPR) repeat protein
MIAFHAMVMICDARNDERCRRMIFIANPEGPDLTNHHSPPFMSVSPSFKKWEVFAFAGLMLLVVLVVFPGLRAALFLDDFDEIRRLGDFSGWGDIWRSDCYGYCRPVKNAIFFAIQPNPNASTLGIHVFGLCCYFWGMAGVYLLTRSLSGNRWLALGCCAMWALAPTQVSTILWLSATNISLSAGFLCMALYTYDKARGGADATGLLSVPWLVLAVSFGFAAQISYEAAVSLAPLAVALDWYRGRKLVSRHGIVAVCVLGVFTAGFLLLRAHYGCSLSMAGKNHDFSPDLRPWQVAVSAPWFLWQHLLMWLFPVGRIEFVGTYIWMKSASPLALVSAGVGLVALVASVFLLRKRFPLASFGVAWFLIASFPAGNFIPVNCGPIADYYVVIPSLGLALALVDLVRVMIRYLRSGEQNWGICAASGVALIVLPRVGYVAFSYFWSSVWSEPVELWLRMLDSRPCQFEIRNMAAYEMLEQGKIAESRELANRSIIEAPWSAMPWFILAEGYFMKNNMRIALVDFEKFIALQSPIKQDTIMFLHIRLGMIKGLDPSTRVEAMDHYRVVLADPSSEYHASAAYELAKLYYADNNTGRAGATLERAIKMNPDNSGLQDAYKRFGEGKGLPGPDEFLEKPAGASDIPMRSRH